MPSPQDLLDLLNALDLEALFAPSLDVKERNAYIKARKARLAHIKQLLKTEMDLIKSRYGRARNEQVAKNIELLPYLGIENILSNINAAITELQAAIVAGGPLPAPPLLGDVIHVKQDNDGYSVLILDRESACKMVEEERLAKIEKVRQALLKARQQIEAKNYAAAQDTLTGVDHPKAYEWLEKVNDLLVQQSLEHIQRRNAYMNKPLVPSSMVPPPPIPPPAPYKPRAPQATTEDDNIKVIAFIIWLVFLVIGAISWLLGHT
jgi:hypothetical protein